jgi:acyl carrier protein
LTPTTLNEKREDTMAEKTITPEAVETTVRDALTQFGPEPEEITLDATFEQLDVDSLDLAELSQIIEDEYGVKLKGEDVGKIKTVGDAVDLVVNRAG